MKKQEIKTVHVSTQIQVIIGRLDGDDVVDQAPINIGVKRLNQEAFIEALEVIEQQRAQLESAWAAALEQESEQEQE